MRITASAAVLSLLAVCLPACAQKPDAPAAEETARSSVGLDGYALSAGPIGIKGVSDDASGLAYSPKTKSIFLVINGSCRIVELGPDGSTRRTISTSGFSDIEGITHVRDNVFCVVEEGRGTMCLVEIDEKTESISYGTASVFKVDSGYLGNRGLEGVAYDAAGKRFFAVKEGDPRKIYEIAKPAPGAKIGAADVKNPWDIQKNGMGMRDLSDIYFHAESGHLLILSDESACVVETTVEGNEIDRLELAGMPQPEGITMDEKGSIYICSEPNTFYIYTKKAPGGKK